MQPPENPAQPHPVAPTPQSGPRPGFNPPPVHRRPGPYGAYPGGPAPVAVPTAMPAAVQAARWVVFSMVGICLALVVAVGRFGSTEVTGQLTVFSLPWCLLGYFALSYHKAGNSRRTGSLITCALQVLWVINPSSQHMTTARFVPALGAVAVLVLLVRKDAELWFKRNDRPAPRWDKGAWPPSR